MLQIPYRTFLPAVDHDAVHRLKVCHVYATLELNSLNFDILICLLEC